MISKEEIIQRFMFNEACKLYPYYCSKGFLTTGFGHNLDANPLTKEQKAFIGHDGRSKPITEQQANYLLFQDLEMFYKDLDRHLPWWRNLDDERQFVMLDLCFNMGIKTLLTFKNTLHYIATGYYIKAAENLLKSKYAKDVGDRAERNAYCLRTGEYDYHASNKKTV